MRLFSKQKKIRGICPADLDSSVIRKLSNLSLVGRFDPKLLLFVQLDVLSALDNDGSDAECRADTGSDGCADRTANNRSDNRAGTGRSSDFDGIALDRALALDGAFGVNAFHVIALDGQNLGQNRAEIRPTRFVQNDLVERQKHFGAALDADVQHAVAIAGGDAFGVDVVGQGDTLLSNTA